MRTRHWVAAGLWAGLAGAGAAQSALPGAQLPDSRPVAVAPLDAERACAYPVVGGAVLLGRGAPIRCAPEAGAVAAAPPGTALGAPAPASNPVGAPSPVAGFQRTWDDGRINFGRGVPLPVSGPVVLGAQAVAPLGAPAGAQVVVAAPRGLRAAVPGNVTRRAP